MIEIQTRPFTKDEKKLILYLHTQYQNQREYLPLSELAEHGIPNPPQSMLYKRLRELGIIRHSSGTEFQILPVIEDIAYQIKNPPPKDYWKGISIWFKSRWWSIPVAVVAVVLPLLFQWYEMLKKLVNWITNAE